MDTKIKRGQILRKLRLLRQLTQNEAAENFGLSQQTYQKYESGKTEPPYDLLCDFANFYGVSADYLLGRTTIKQMASEQPDIFEALGLKKSVDDDEFIRLYNTLPDFVKQIFVDTMAQLAQATKNNLQKKPTNLAQSVLQPTMQNYPQQAPVQPQQVETEQPWIMVARSTDGKSSNRMMTQEEIDYIESLEDFPESGY